MLKKLSLSLAVNILLMAVLTAVLVGCTTKTESQETPLVDVDQSQADQSQTEDTTLTPTRVEPTPVDGRTAPEEAVLAAAEAEYMEYYYYEPENLLRYYFYQLDTGYAADEVVWRVNMNLDKEPYEDAELITDVDTLALIVNKRFYLPEDYVPDNLVYLTSGRQVTQDTKTAYDVMVACAAAEGYSLMECSAYRSIAYQTSLYNKYLSYDSQEEVDSYSARPGFSEHHTGRTIDLIGPTWVMSDFVNTPESDWIQENAYKFGFIVRYNENNVDVTGYKAEPWHITYVGTLHALMMHELGYESFEEYVAKYVEYTPEGFQFPDTPELPEVPATPSVPVTPSIPVTTPEPEPEPEIPTEPENPAEPEIPEEPEVPEEPEFDLETEPESPTEQESDPEPESELEPELEENLEQENTENLDNLIDSNLDFVI